MRPHEQLNRALSISVGVLLLTTVAAAADVSLSATPGLPIEDLQTTSDVLTSATSFVVADVKLGLDISHTYTADLDIDLSSPFGTSVVITADQGGGSDDILVSFATQGTDFDESLLTAGLGFQMRAYGPGNMLDFDGEDSAGDWTLSIYDDAPYDQGTLNAWYLDLSDVPAPVPLQPVESLGCTPVIGGAILNWSNPMAFDAIAIYIDGALFETLSGFATSISLDLAESESFELCVETQLSGWTPIALCCTVVVPGDPSDAHIIVQGETAGLVDSVTALEAALPFATQIVPRVSDILGTPAAVWCCMGTFPASTALSAEDGQMLHDFIVAGVPVYVSGGDVWGFDTATAFSSVDGVSIAYDGGDGHHAMIGGDFLTGFDATYTQDQSGSDWTDELQPATSGSDELGSDARVIWSDSVAAFKTGIAYYGENGNRVISMSSEFGGYNGDQTSYAAALAGFLLGGAPPSSGFARGDANVDGVYDISDVVYSLASLFIVGSESPPCEDAADVNDDGTFDISDPVYSLAALFTFAALPPAPGPDACGPDPTSDALACDSYGACD